MLPPCLFSFSQEPSKAVLYIGKNISRSQSWSVISLRYHFSDFVTKQQVMSQVVGQTEHRKADQGHAWGGIETCSVFASVSPRQLPEAGSRQDEH